MSDEKKPLRQTLTEGDYVIRLRWEPWETGKVGWVDFEIIAITGYSGGGAWGEGTPCYRRAGATHGMDIIEDIERAQVDVQGFVKWDGCTQFWCEDEPVHFDDPEGLESWCKALKTAQKAAYDACTVDP